MRHFAMRLLISWVRDFVDVTASAEEIAEKLALRGFEVAVDRDASADDDAVIDFEVTANRPDCLSVVGFAREIGTALRPARPSSRRPRPAPACRIAPAADRRVRSADGHARGRRALPALRGGGRRGHADGVAALDDRPAAGRRRPPDQPDRRHHQLRADGARPSDARLRSGDARRAASCGSGGRAPARP